MTLQSNVKFRWDWWERESVGSSRVTVAPRGQRHEMHEDGTASQLTAAGTCSKVFGGIFFGASAVTFGSMQVIVHGTLIHPLQGMSTNQSMAVDSDKGEGTRASCLVLLPSYSKFLAPGTRGELLELDPVHLLSYLLL